MTGLILLGSIGFVLWAVFGCGRTYVLRFAWLAISF